MNYDYLICGLRVRFCIPWEVKTTAESEAFLTFWETDVAPDLTVNFILTDALAELETGGMWHVDSYYLHSGQEQRIWHCPIRGEPPYCCMEWKTASSNAVTCYCLRGQEYQIAYTKNLLELLGLELFLLHFRTMILHSSLVDWQGNGILFCAPSGTGKSTQAALWEQYMGSQTLNGDRAGICCDKGIWKAWGLPFAGTSGIYCNRSVPIRAVILLRQGTHNMLTPVRPMDAFKRLLPECSARRWDPGFMEPLINLLSRLLCDVPVYQLECLPDREAVELLYNSILKEN